MIRQPRDPAIGFPRTDILERLDDLRRQLDSIPPGHPEGLSVVRGNLESFAAEAEIANQGDLAPVLKRLALLTEVWECLAAECAASGAKVAAFVNRAFDAIHRAGQGSNENETLAWILEE